MAHASQNVSTGGEVVSKNNNVNPGQYKVAGRERQGENLEQTKDKQAFNAPIPNKRSKPERQEQATRDPAKRR